MRKSILLAFMLSMAFLSYGQSIQMSSSQVQKTTDLPESIKGEIPTAVSADMLAELLQMDLIQSQAGDLHPSIMLKPEILAKEISSNSIIEATFRRYITTQDESERLAAESQLLELY